MEKYMLISEYYHSINLAISKMQYINKNT